MSLQHVESMLLYIIYCMAVKEDKEDSSVKEDETVKEVKSVKEDVSKVKVNDKAERSVDASGDGVANLTDIKEK